MRTLLPIALAIYSTLSGAAQVLKVKDPVVPTASGSVSGKFDLRSQIASFKGIPFGAPPVGELRWAPPTPVSPWKYNPGCVSVPGQLHAGPGDRVGSFHQ